MNLAPLYTVPQCLLCLLILSGRPSAQFRAQWTPPSPSPHNFLAAGARIPDRNRGLGRLHAARAPAALNTKVTRPGVVTACKGNATFDVLLDGTEKTVGRAHAQIHCALSGRLYHRRVRIADHSKVNVKIDLMFPEKGTIVERLSAL